MGLSESKSHYRRRLLVMAASGVMVAIILSLEGPDWFESLVHWMQPAPNQVPQQGGLTRAHPIGPPLVATPMRPKGNDSSVSPVPLPLILVRTFPGRNSREGTAQLGVNAQSPQTYGAGALLLNNARLTEIYTDYVVLEKDGRSVRLYLQDKARPGKESFADLLTVGGRALPAPMTGGSYNRLTDVLRPSPVFAGTQLRGYALYPGRESETFAGLGLKPGDVVTEIDGTPVTDPDSSLAALQTLVSGAALTVVVERSGARHRISVDGANVMRASVLPHVGPG